MNDSLEIMAYNCARSYREFADEVIIVEDGGRRSPALLEIADIYVYHDENLGFTSNINMGWKLTTKDFVFLVNSDTYIESGNPQDLCISGYVTSPEQVGFIPEHINGGFFVVPDTVRQERGLLDESMKMYCSDGDYYLRVKDIFRRVESVRFRQIGGASTKFMNARDRLEQDLKDRQIFTQKWGDNS